MASTLAYGVIISGVAGSYVPHRLRQHTDVDQATGVATNDVLAWSGTEWTPKGTDELPAGTHDHSGVYVPVATLASYATLASPAFTTGIEISGAAPQIKFSETDGLADSRIYYDGDAFFIRRGGVDVQKLDGTAGYSFLSNGAIYRSLTASATISNPVNVVYVDATAGNIVLTLNAAASYLLSNGSNYSGAVLVFVRKDSTGNTVTLTPNGSEKIDGAATLAITGIDSMVMVQAVVGGWNVIRNYSSAFSTTDSGWINLTITGWSGAANVPTQTLYSPTYVVPKYRKVNGIVYFTGTARTPASPLPSILGTLPVGYRPQYEISGLMSKWTSATIQGAAAELYRIATDGTIDLMSIGGDASYHFHPVSFPAA